MKTHLDQVRETWGNPETYVRTVWGQEAVFDLEGRSCLIHLDRPDAETRRRRIEEVRARQAELAAADCPLCREMAELGGDEVFDREEVQPGDEVVAHAGAGARAACGAPVGPSREAARGEPRVPANGEAEAEACAAAGTSPLATESVDAEVAAGRGSRLPDAQEEDDEAFDTGPWSRAGVRLDLLERFPPRMAQSVLRTVLRSHVEELCDDLAGACALRPRLLELRKSFEDLVRSGEKAPSGNGAFGRRGPSAGIRKLRRRLFTLARLTATSESAIERLVPEKVADLRAKLSALGSLLERPETAELTT
ncbi:MAG: hypothetical protein HYZ53_21530 [Planctomycetes bacterium]|nr:hypothetical protein [Planctomycetota bacterium]